MLNKKRESFFVKHFLLSFFYQVNSIPFLSYCFKFLLKVCQDEKKIERLTKNVNKKSEAFFVKHFLSGIFCQVFVKFVFSGYLRLLILPFFS